MSKHKRYSRCESGSSDDTTPSSDDSSSSSSETKRRKKKRHRDHSRDHHKKKKKREEKKHKKEKELWHKRKKRKEKIKKPKVAEKKHSSAPMMHAVPSTFGPRPLPSSTIPENAASIPAKPEPIKRSLAPMTKEEYDRQQSVLRRVVDPETGRQRLVKGDGEIVEEIVSREKHRAINKLATQGDGYAFQAGLRKLT